MQRPRCQNPDIEDLSDVPLSFDEFMSVVGSKLRQKRSGRHARARLLRLIRRRKRYIIQGKVQVHVQVRVYTVLRVHLPYSLSQTALGGLYWVGCKCGRGSLTRRVLDFLYMNISTFLRGNDLNKNLSVTYKSGYAI